KAPVPARSSEPGLADVFFTILFEAREHPDGIAANGRARYRCRALRARQIGHRDIATVEARAGDDCLVVFRQREIQYGTSGLACADRVSSRLEPPDWISSSACPFSACAIAIVPTSLPDASSARTLILWLSWVMTS